MNSLGMENFYICIMTKFLFQSLFCDLLQEILFPITGSEVAGIRISTSECELVSAGIQWREVRDKVLP